MFVVLALGLVVGWAWFVGGVLSRPDKGDPLRPAIRFVAGLVALHLLLQLLSATGWGWSRPVLLLALASVAGASWFGVRLLTTRDSARHVPAAAAAGAAGHRFAGVELSPWDALHLAPIGLLALVALTVRAPIPDFYYHWGMKARRFFEVADFDLAFLARPENGYFHPDYPVLPSELFTVTALLGGRWAPPLLMLWTVVFFLLLIWVARSELGAIFEPRQAALASAGMAFAIGAFSIGYYQSGGADLPLAAVLLLGALLLTRDREGDALAVGFCAALLAALKLEGISAAFFLLVLFGLRLVVRQGTAALRDPKRLVSWMSLLAPAGIVVGVWMWQVHSFGLFSGGNTSGFGFDNFGKIGPVLSGVGWSLTRRAWYGVPFLLVLLPVLFFGRRTRWISALLSLQLAFYFYAYLAAPQEPRLLVMASFPRLALHLLPSLLVALFLALPRHALAHRAPAEKSAATAEPPS